MRIPLALACALWCTSAWTLQDAAPSTAKPAAAALKRDVDSCRTHSNLDACYDAIRRSPSDPALLVALGDALMHAGRPADALRNYKRAASIAPATRGLTAKISSAEAKSSAKRPPRPSAVAAVKRYSNSAPEAQSH
jgi:cytochrome c-type biogenesis protein CcmH/NrfG